MKTVFSSLILLLVSLLLCLPNAFAQEYMKDYLPEGAKSPRRKGICV